MKLSQNPRVVFLLFLVGFISSFCFVKGEIDADSGLWCHYGFSLSPQDYENNGLPTSHINLIFLRFVAPFMPKKKLSLYADAIMLRGQNNSLFLKDQVAGILPLQGSQVYEHINMVSLGNLAFMLELYDPSCEFMSFDDYKHLNDLLEYLLQWTLVETLMYLGTIFFVLSYSLGHVVGSFHSKPKGKEMKKKVE